MSSLSQPSLATSSHNNDSNHRSSSSGSGSGSADGDDDDGNNNHWDNLRQLVSDFHNHVYVELPTILECIRDVVFAADADYDNSSIISNINDTSSSSSSQSQSQSQSSSSRFLPSYQHQPTH
ncbi:MAG: hypothetical protein ACI8RD_003721, partial [Bacillariaceae sp.]